MNSVKVSVIVPVYHGQKTIEASIKSVLSQDYSNMEIIIIDDGSTDNSWSILSKIKDSRIVLSKQTNEGLSFTLNRGLTFARGDYLARQDQDDLVLPDRIRKQVEFLEADKLVAIVGTWARIYKGNVETNRFHRHPITSEGLNLELLFDNPFVHSSIPTRSSPCYL